MSKKSTYDNQSISSLKGAERVRKRPAVIFGSDGIDGCQHSFFEILSNSIDEAKEGYGNIINVQVFNDHSMCVEDFGRGVPLDWNEKEGKYNWELVYCELYAGGKYKHLSKGNDAYEYSLGLNGLGACATQYASEFMEVTSYQGGTKYFMSFKKGEPVGELQKEGCPRTKSGTVVKWKPDNTVFTDINIDYDYFCETMMKQAVVNAGLTLNLKFQTLDGDFKENTFYYENGIVDYINERIGETALMPVAMYSGERIGRDREDLPDYKLKMDLAFSFSNDKPFIEYYHNSSFLENGGSPDKATKSALVTAIDDYLRNNNKYTKNESKITFPDVQDSLVLISNSFSTAASYANQTKKAITNVFIAKAMTDFFKHCVQAYFAENPTDAERVCNQVLINKRSRESAENMRVNTRKKLTSSLDINNTVEKFVNCRSKDPEKRELYIVEGDSALGSVKFARNSEFQAVIPVRGKTFNCLKAGYDKILKNDIVTDLLKVIGCGVEIKTKSKDVSSFDLKSMKWKRIIICTDADVDGFHIRTLILTMFYRLLPTLINEGYVYIAETPLYSITTKEGNFFAYDEKEKQDILDKIGNKKYSIERSKGLGENTADMMSECAMNPATRRLVRVVPEDEAKTYEKFDILLGENLSERKMYIAENGAKYLDMIDVY